MLTTLESKHFTLQTLAEGVFVAIAKDGGSAICNAGLIDLGGETIVYDTFLTPQAAEDFKQSAVSILGQTPQIVINSHYHNDHIWGNQVFLPEAQIISSTRTRELIATAGLEEFQYYSSNSAERLEFHRSQTTNSLDKQGQDEHSLWIGYYEGLVEALPHLKVCMPSITFDRYLEIHGENRTAKLISFDGGHTHGDTVLYLPEDGIVFMSDLLFVGMHPYLADGDPHKLLNALRELSQLDATRFIPGHGPLGTSHDLLLLIEYVEHCFETAQKLVEGGNPEKDWITGLTVDERYQHWQISQFYSANISFLCESLIKTS